MNQLKQQHIIYIYDHAESKIQFLEQTLIGRDWRATIVYPDGTDQKRQNIAEAKTAFENRGYQVRERTNDNGHHTLEIHHLDENSKPSDIMRELGLVKGVGYLISHPSTSLEAILGGGQKALDVFEQGVRYTVKSVKDPAHMNGLFYIAAEVFLMWPGKSKDPAMEKKALEAFKESVADRPKNILRKLGFGLFFAQSATYLFAAKDNDATSFDEFKNKITRTHKQGGKLSDLHYDAATDKAPEGIGQTAISLLRRFPIEAGALFNNLGMVLYIAGSIKDRNYYRLKQSTGATGKLAQDAADYLKQGTGFLKLKNAGGFTRDIGGAVTSMIAWPFMLIKPKKKEENENAPEHSNIFTRTWNAFRENPQIGAGVLTLAASGQRFAGARSRGETNQMRGEAIYIGGDLTLLFTKNEDYGKKTGNVDALAEKIADYINKMPLILGPSHQEKIVQNMANFLLEKGLAEIKEKPKTATFTAKDLKERADLLVIEVGRRVRNSYGEQMEQLGDMTAHLVAQFAPAHRPAVITQMAQTLSQLPWVYATAEELKPVLERSLSRLPAPTEAMEAPTMKSLRPAVGDMMSVMHGYDIDIGGSVATIYDALTPFLRAQPAPAKPTTIVTHAQHITPMLKPATHLPAHA